MPNDASAKKVVFITGASSGIGAGISREFARKGFRVALVARRLERLQEEKTQVETLGGEALVVEADVRDGESMAKAVKAVTDQWGRIDVVVANAGFVVSGPLSKLTVDDYRRQFDTNVFGVLHTIYATRAALIETKGILSIVGSVAGHVATPLNTAYTMSKFAVRALSLGLRLELRRRGVAVVLVSPGFVGTELAHVDNSGQFQETAVLSMPKRFTVPLGRVVPAIVRGILSRKSEVVITNHGKVLVTLNRLFPRILQAAIGQMR